MTKTRIIATTAVLGTLAFSALAPAASAGGTPLAKPIVGVVAVSGELSTSIPTVRGGYKAGNITVTRHI